MEFKIRYENEKDVEQVRRIVRAAFPTPAESQLVDALRANGKSSLSLVAENNDRLLGHILFSAVSTIPPSATKGIGLAPVAVHPDFQSRGIGSELIRRGLQALKEQGYDYCVVLGNPNYYQRFGFEKASTFGLGNEYGVDDEFMVIRLSESSLAARLVKYAIEFALFSV